MKRTITIICAALVMIVVISAAGCRNDEAGESPPPGEILSPAAGRPDAAPPAQPAPSADRPDEPEAAPIPPHVRDLVQTAPSSTRQFFFDPGGERDEEHSQPPAEPTEDLVIWFVTAMRNDIQNRSMRFLLARLAADAEIRLTMGDRVQELSRQEWYARSMTSLQLVQDYNFRIIEWRHSVDGMRVNLDLQIEESYVHEGRAHRGRTHQSMDLEYQSGDFVIHSMLAETSSTPAN